jgi:hypothetical protein
MFLVRQHQLTILLVNGAQTRNGTLPELCSIEILPGDLAWLGASSSALLSALDALGTTVFGDKSAPVDKPPHAFFAASSGMFACNA